MQPATSEQIDAAHPRSRGENQARQGSAALPGGSSPLTRGKRYQLVSSDPHERLIPAHAGKTPCSPRPSRTCSAHPRSRGENAASITFSFAVRGSSPLTRGKRLCVRHRLRDRRLIPAHAGKTRDRARRSANRRAHPRSRGENSSVVTFWLFATGSSPLTRGKRLDLGAERRFQRLIPAHAGKTLPTDSFPQL